MRTGHEYVLSVPVGQCKGDGFWTDLTPKQMLSLGFFGGKYMTDCAAEFPAEWLSDAKLCHEQHGPALNLFGILASQPLAALLGAMADPFLTASARKSVPSRSLVQIGAVFCGWRCNSGLLFPCGC